MGMLVGGYFSQSSAAEAFGGDNWWSLVTQDGTDSGSNPVDLTTNGTPTAETSMRLDGTGNSSAFPSGANMVPPAQVWIKDFSVGFTVEYMFRAQAWLARATGDMAGGVGMCSNAGAQSVFVLRFDNFNASATTTPRASFALLRVGTIYQDNTGYATSVIGDARASIDGSINRTYHLLGTYNNATGQLDLYVDGVLAGTDTLSAAEIEEWGYFSTPTNQNCLSNIERIFRNSLLVGTQFFQGAFRATQSRLQDVRFHEGVYMDAAQAAVQAELANSGV